MKLLANASKDGVPVLKAHLRCLHGGVAAIFFIKEEVVYSGSFRLSEVNSGFQDFTQTPFFWGAGNSDTIM